MRVGCLLTLGETALVGVLLVLLACSEVPSLRWALWVLLGRLLPGGEASLMHLADRHGWDATPYMVRAPRHNGCRLLVTRVARADRHGSQFWRAGVQRARRLRYRTMPSQLSV